MSTSPACFQIGSAASAATSTPWTATTTFFSTNWLAQFTDDSGVTSRLQVSAFIGRPLIPPSSSLTYLTPDRNASRISGSEICAALEVVEADEDRRQAVVGLLRRRRRRRPAAAGRLRAAARGLGAAARRGCAGRRGRGPRRGGRRSAAVVVAARGSEHQPGRAHGGNEHTWSHRFPHSGASRRRATVCHPVHAADAARTRRAGQPAAPAGIANVNGRTPFNRTTRSRRVR